MNPQFRKLAAISVLLLQIGCGYPGIPRKPSLDLPQPPDDLRAIRKSDKVYLSWTIPTHTADRLLIHHLGVTRVCRTTQPKITECRTPAGEIPNSEAVVVMNRNKKPVSPKRTAEFIDTIPAQPLSNAFDQFVYGVEVTSQRGRSAGLSNLSSVPAAPTLSAPTGLHAEVTYQGVLLTWQAINAPAMPGLSFKYRVYRREGTNPEDVMAGESPLAEPTLLDRSIEWEKVYSYRVNVVTIISPPEKPESEVEGDDSTAIQLLTHDVFPPAVPSGLQAVFSGVGQQPFIDLVWRPDTDPDLAGYNIYRRQNEQAPEKINSELVKKPAYRDTNVSPGTVYYYSVSAVDVRGNESAPSAQASEAVPRSQ